MGRPSGDVWVAKRQSMPFLMANAQCLECCVDLLAFPIAPVSPGARRPDVKVGLQRVSRRLPSRRFFLVKALRYAPSSGLARDDDVTSSGWHGEAWLSSPEDDRCCIEETTPLFFIASTWNHRRVTSVPVITSEPLNPRAGSFHSSGLVSSREGNMLSQSA
ncbi:hypothetical protein MTO96_006169 [Rhipicephalus appendiculatus]